MNSVGNDSALVLPATATPSRKAGREYCMAYIWSIRVPGIFVLQFKRK